MRSAQNGKNFFKALRLFALMLAFAVGFCTRAVAQDISGLEQGLKPYGAYHGGDIDSVSMVNGSLTVHIPLVSYPQRGGRLHLGYSIVYNTPSLSAHAIGAICSPNICFPTGISYKSSSEFSNSVHTDLQIVPDFYPGVGLNYLNTNVPCEYSAGGCLSLGPNFEDYSVVDYDGANHHFGQTGTNSWLTRDATGYALNTTVTTDNTLVMTDRNGTQYSYMAFPPLTEDTGSGTIQVGPARWGPIVRIEDTNGNFMTANYTVSGSGTSTTYMPTGWTDTLSRPYPWVNGAVTMPGLPVPNGGTSPFTVSSTLSTFTFPQLDGTACTIPLTANCTYSGYSNSVIQSVGLPNGTAYTFSYDPYYGTLSQITLPTGGTISYTWTESIRCTGEEGIPDYPSHSLAVASRTVDANDGTGPHTWNYTYNASSSPYYFQTIVTDPLPLSNDTVHTMTAIGTQVCANVFETESDRYAGSYTGGTLLEKTVTTYESASDPYGLVSTAGYNSLGGLQGLAMNVVPTSITTTDVVSGKTSRVTKSYDAGIGISRNGSQPPPVNAIYGNLIQKNDYDFGSTSGTPGSLLRTTNTAYMALSGPNHAQYLANNLLSIPYTDQVLNGAGTQASFTQYNYDESAPLTTGMSVSSQLDTAPPTGTYRGNNTSIFRWLNVGILTCPNNQSGGTSSYIISHNIYNDSGTLKYAAEPCGDSTTYLYSPAYVGAYLTTVTNALGQSTTYTYDFNTGLKTSVTDANQQQTTYGYDSSWRLISVNQPDTGALTYCYSDSVSGKCTGAVTAPSVLFTEQISSTTSEQLEADVDGIGRKIKDRVLSDTDGIDLTEFTYDALGREQSVSNPYRTTSDPTYGITSYTYDALGRKIYQCQPDNSSTSSTTCTPQNSYLAWSYNGNAVTSSDENGSQWQRTTDALGRLTKVVEPGSLTTNYSYDALGNLWSVNQQGNGTTTDTARVRSYTYDSLSRLICASNPENSSANCPTTVSNTYVTGTNGYTYDPNGNVSSKTDARGVTINYSYDSLNRLRAKTYSNSSIMSCYAYDIAAKGIGRLGTEWTTANSCTTTAGYQTMRQSLAYDPMGRLWNEQQCVLGHCTSGPTPPCAANGNNTTPYQTYCYDLAGNMTWSVNGVSNVPSVGSISFTQLFDAVSRLSTLTSSWNDGTHPPNLFTATPTISYTPAGALQNYVVGNSNISITKAYDNRLRTTGETATH